MPANVQSMAMKSELVCEVIKAEREENRRVEWKLIQ